MTTSRFRHPWYLCWWLMYPQPRVHVTNSQLTYILTLVLFFLLFILILLLFQLATNPDPSPTRILYVPMVQFNRGDVNKEQVMDNARRCLEKVSDFQNGHEDLKDPKVVFQHLMHMMDKREKRQFSALEAFNIFDIDDFEALMTLGYDSHLHSSNNSVNPPIDYKSMGERIEFVNPNYEKLCYKTAFTLSNSSRWLDPDFCARLKDLESGIRSGVEPPLLTLYTWWPDPITDLEILSKRAVMANWNLFRPFIVPVVFTNYRMNMAVANAQAWPCLPVTEENEDGVPVFKNTAFAMDKKFNSTFRGYAIANSMFDSSLLQTLLSVKDKFLNESSRSSKTPILIYGNQINMPALGSEAYSNHETFHKQVEHEFSKNESTAASTKNNYIFYKDMDFDTYAPVIIDDEYLIPYLARRSMQEENTIVINTSQTILSAKTYRHKEVNEWGRFYVKYKRRDRQYNQRLIDGRKGDGEEGKEEEMKAKHYRTVYDEEDRIQVKTFE